MQNIIAYDLGTGGIKASLYEADGKSLASTFVQYETYYPYAGWYEQRPMDWWDSVCKATQILLKETSTNPKNIACLAISGQSLVAVPLNKEGEILLTSVPIWSDGRAADITREYFKKTSYDHWYLTTGNGDPAECYTIMKLIWMQKNMPEVIKNTDVVLGSKDFINYMFTGEIYTDPSYASGSGVFDLEKWSYSDKYIEVSELPKSIFPTIVPSHAVIGCVTESAAQESGLAQGTLVACGGVDNSCMALGARGLGEGKIYTSLGSSSWIAITSCKPIVDIVNRPFVFAHIEKGVYTSATSIFSAGSSLRWMRDRLCPEVHDDPNSYNRLCEWAAEVPAGSNGILFNPSLAGGSAQEKSSNILGGFMGLSLRSTRADMIRACMEGVALNLKSCLEYLQKYVQCDKEMLLCGGGSKSPLWRQIFADVFDLDILKTNIDQDTASLGAAAIAARSIGLWNDYSRIESLHQIQSVEKPIPENVYKYGQLYRVFKLWSNNLANMGDKMQALHEKGIW